MAYAYLGSGSNGSGSPTGTTLTITGVTFTAGDYVLVFITYGSSAVVFTESVTDNGGNTYLRASQSVIKFAGGDTQAVYYCASAAASTGTTITLTLGTTAQFRGMGYVRYSGLTGAPVVAAQDVDAVGTGANAYTSGTLNPSAQPGALIGITYDDNAGAISVGTGFTSRTTFATEMAANGTSNLVEDIRITAYTPVAATFSNASGTADMAVFGIFVAETTNTPAPAPTTYLYVGAGSGSDASTSGTVLVVPALYTAGDYVILFVTYQSTTPLSEIVDDGINKYYKLGSTLYNLGSGDQQSLYFCPSVAAGFPLITFTVGASVPFRGLGYMRYSGLIGNPTVVRNTQIQTASGSNAVTSGLVKPLGQPGALIGLTYDNNAGVTTAGTGFTVRGNFMTEASVNTTSSLIEDQRLTALTATAATFTNASGATNSLTTYGIWIAETSFPGTTGNISRVLLGDF